MSFCHLYYEQPLTLAPVDLVILCSGRGGKVQEDGQGLLVRPHPRPPPHLNSLVQSLVTSKRK